MRRKGMKVYILIYKEDSDDDNRTQVSPYSAESPAREEMKSAYEKALQALHFDTSVQSEGHRCLRTKRSAFIENGMDYYSWDIEEHNLKDLFVK